MEISYHNAEEERLILQAFVVAYLADDDVSVEQFLLWFQNQELTTVEPSEVIAALKKKDSPLTAQKLVAMEVLVWVANSNFEMGRYCGVQDGWYDASMATEEERQEFLYAK